MTTITRTYLQKLSRINKHLKRGDIADIALMTGFSQSHVSNVINGVHCNSYIISVAYQALVEGRMYA